MVYFFLPIAEQFLQDVFYQILFNLKNSELETYMSMLFESIKGEHFLFISYRLYNKI